MLDLTLLAQEIAAIVAEQVAAAVAPLAADKASLLARMDALETASVDHAAIREMVDGAVAALPAPSDGKSVTAEDVAPLIAAEVERAVAAMPLPQDGKSVTIDDVRPLIESAIAAIPKPADGKSVTVDDVTPLVAAEVERAVAALPPPRDGISVSLNDIRPLIAEAVAALPPPRDGQSVTAADVQPIIAREVERAIAALPGPVGIAGAMIDRKGSLMVTLSDGKLVDLGRVDGKDGDPGLGFDDLAIEQTDERTFVMRFHRGEQMKEFTFAIPVMIDRGVYRSGTAYEKGDCVTYGGSLWIAQGGTEAKPDGADSGWRLGVKRGRDGRGPEARL